MLFLKKNFYLIITIFNFLLFILFLNIDLTFYQIFYTAISFNLVSLFIYLSSIYLYFLKNNNIVKGSNIFYLSDYKK